METRSWEERLFNAKLLGWTAPWGVENVELKLTEGEVHIIPPEDLSGLPRMSQTSHVHQPKRKSTVLLLCLLALGCHRYYVGKLGSGRLYLFTGELLMVGVVIDTCLILSGSFEDQFTQPLE